MKRSLLAALCALLALSSSACGGGKGDAAARTATASLQAELLQQSASGASAFRFSAGQAQCTASRVVDAVGTTRLRSYGLLDAENKATTKTLDDTTLSTKDATAVVNAVIDCLGSDTFTSTLRTAVGKSFSTAKTAAQRACLESKLTIATLKPMLIATLSGDHAAGQTFAHSLLACASTKK